jgi:hypothetical protein
MAADGTHDAELDSERYETVEPTPTPDRAHIIGCSTSCAAPSRKLTERSRPNSANRPLPHVDRRTCGTADRGAELEIARQHRLVDRR